MFRHSKSSKLKIIIDPNGGAGIIAKEILEKLIAKPFDVRAYVNKQGLGSVSDTGMLEKLCKEAMDENPMAVEDYKHGEARALNFIVGKVMAKTKGKATPKDVDDILKRLL